MRIADGEPVEATINAEVDTGWRATPILVAEPHLKARPKVPSCCSPGTTTPGITA